MGLEKLLNNEKMHDVTFLVGKSRTKMYGHKLILSTHNEFFNTMLSSSFADSQKGEFIITDIEEDIFMEILRFMYCETANLTADNFFPIYKAADKYLMADLKDFCKNFLNEDIVIKVLIENAGSAKFSDLENACIELICNNPLRFFNDEKFKSLSKELLELICTKVKANRIQYCSNHDILSAIDKWTKFKVITDGEREALKALKLSINKNERNCRVFFDITRAEIFKPERSGRTTRNNIDLNVLTPCTLFGLGPFVREKRISIKVYSNDPITNAMTTDKQFVYDIKLRTDNPVQDLFVEKIKLSTGQKISFSCECYDGERYFSFTKFRTDNYFMILNGYGYANDATFEYLLIEN